MKNALKNLKRFIKRKVKRKHLKPGVIACSLLFLLYCTLSYTYLPDCAELKTKNPAQSKLMEVRIESAEWNGTKLKVSHKWVPLNDISRDLVRAVLTGEDTSFFWHSGFDIQEFFKALKESTLELSLPRGASTITQQLAKNLYLADSWLLSRKVKEIIVTSRLEKQLSKKRILELYLNFIEWGEGIFGAEAAAQHYFNKHASNLTLDESIFLAAIVPSPLGAFNPVRHSKRVANRGRIIRKKMPFLIIPKNAV